MGIAVIFATCMRGGGILMQGKVMYVCGGEVNQREGIICMWGEEILREVRRVTDGWLDGFVMQIL